MKSPKLSSKNETTLNIPDTMVVNQVTHRYGGNGFAVVQMLQDEWARVAYIGKGEFGSQFSLVWSKLITPETNIIKPDLLKKIKDVRDRLEGGLWKIEKTRLVKAV